MKNIFICILHASIPLLIVANFQNGLLAQNVGIGVTTPAGKLHIKGAANVSQLIIDGSATQSNLNPLIRLRKNDGTVLLSIHSDDSTNTFIGHNTGRVNNITGGLNNTFIGSGAGQVNTLGSGNTASGFRALYSNTTANQNTGIGVSALYSQSFDNGGEVWISANTAVGFQALYANQPTETFNGIVNTAIGHGALRNNTIGSYNTASGGSALLNNTTGFSNTADGYKALNANTKGYFNTAQGYNALYSNTTGANNTAIGREALSTQSYENAGGVWNSNNTAVGSEALYYNAPVSTATGINNTAVGSKASYSNTVGHSNTAIGANALNLNTIGHSNTAIGANALEKNTTGFSNIAIGFGAGTETGGLYNTISIGNHGWLNGFQNQAFIGNGSTAWIGGWVGWSIFSDARVKNDIREDVKGLDFILRLRPVTFHRSLRAMKEITGNKETEAYPGKYDVEKVKYTGFLAQEVEKAANASSYDFSGLQKPKDAHDLYSLSYAEFVVPLVKGMQEQQAIIEEQNKKLKALQDDIEMLKAAIAEKIIIERFNLSPIKTMK